MKLSQVADIEGLNEDGAAFVRRLRLHRDAIMLALAHFDPGRMVGSQVLRIVSLEEIALAGRRIKARSGRPWHDLALFYLLFATGARPLKIARLEVRDYLNPDGSVRRASEMRAEVTITGKTRPLYFVSTRLDEALGFYLDERLKDRFPLSERLYVPEPFNEANKAAAAMRRREKLSVLRPHEGHSPLAIVMGEFKATEATASGRRVWIRHMPDAPLLVANKTWERIERLFVPIFEAGDADSGHKVRIVLAALVRARREHTYEIDALSLMMTSEHWIPVEGIHEFPTRDNNAYSARGFKTLWHRCVLAAIEEKVLTSGHALHLPRPARLLRDRLQRPHWRPA